MDKFRYYINLGTGYNLIDVYDNKIKTVIERGESDLIESRELSGSLSFVGQLAEDIFNKRSTLYKIPFKIEEYNGTIWQTFHECYVDIRGGYQRLSRVAIITKFREFDKPETKILAQLKQTFNISELGNSPLQVLQDIVSQLLTIDSLPTSLNQTDYKTYYNIESNYTSPRYSDNRWKYFYHVGTTGTSPNLIHQYACNSFDFDPLLDGYDKINLNGVNYWVIITVSGDPLDIITDSIVCEQNYGLTNTLNSICQAIDSTVNFSALYANGFSAVNTYIGNTSEFLNEDSEGIEISLENIFKLLRTIYSVDWYIDAGFLKFAWKPLEYYIDTIDWSLETINVNNIDFSENKPDLEYFSFLDKDRKYDIYVNPSLSSSFKYSTLNLSYFEKGIPTDNNIIDYSLDWYADLFALKKSEPESTKPVLIIYDYTLKTLTINDSKDYYLAGNGLTFGGKNCERFSQYNPFYVNHPDKSQAYNVATSPSNDNRPIYEIQYNKWLNDYTALSLFSRILFNNGNTGYLNKVEIDMSTGNALFYIRFKEINL